MSQASAFKLSRWEHREPGSQKALGLSLLAHAALAIMFMLHLNWKTSSTPAGVEVEIWDNATPPPIEQPRIEEPVKITEPVDEKAEIVTKKKKEEPKEPKEKPKAEEKKPVVTPPPKPVEKPKPKEEPKPKPKEEPKEKPKPKEEVKEKPKPVDKPTVNKPSAAEQAAAEKARADNLAKLRAAAGQESGSGGTVGTGVGGGGNASPGYADKVRRTIKPRIIFNPNSVEGNPPVSVHVELAPDGRIIGRRVTKSSGVSDWDEAVLRALDSVGSMPKDDNGTVPRQLNLIFKPKD